MNVIRPCLGGGAGSGVEEAGGALRARGQHARGVRPGCAQHDVLSELLGAGFRAW